MIADCPDQRAEEQALQDWDIRLELADELDIEPEHVTDDQIEERRLGDPDDYHDLTGDR